MKFFYKAINKFSGTVKYFPGASLFLCLILYQNSFAQSFNALPENFSNLSLISDSVKNKQSVKKSFTMKKDPWKAVGFSAILPGAGQYYNESYWKIPVILGLGGYFVYELVKNNNSYLDYKEQYSNSQTPKNPEGDLYTKSLRDFYRDQRDDFIIYSVILYVVNLIDAYVDAQLYDFDVSDKLKISLSGKKQSVGFNVNF